MDVLHTVLLAGCWGVGEHEIPRWSEQIVGGAEEYKEEYTWPDGQEDNGMLLKDCDGCCRAAIGPCMSQRETVSLVVSEMFPHVSATAVYQRRAMQSQQMLDKGIRL